MHQLDRAQNEHLVSKVNYCVSTEHMNNGRAEPHQTRHYKQEVKRRDHSSWAINSLLYSERADNLYTAILHGRTDDIMR